jgi:hypothetical protein
MKEPKQLLDTLFDLDLSTCQVALVLASYEKESDTPTCAHIAMKASLAEVFREIVAVKLFQIKRDADLRVRPFGLDSHPEGPEIEALQLNVSPFDLIGKQIDELSRPIAGMPAYRPDQAFLHAIRYYVIVLQLPEGHVISRPICFFRQYIPSRKLGHSLLAAVSVGQGYYDTVRPNEVDVVLFDQEIDACALGNTMFVFDKEHMQRMFHFNELLTQTVEESVHILSSRITLSDTEAFSEACKRDPRKAAKLRSIIQHPYLSRLTLRNLASFIHARKLEIHIEHEMIIFEPETVWTLLRLLNDDFLESHLTGERYEVTAKRESDQKKAR